MAGSQNQTARYALSEHTLQDEGRKQRQNLAIENALDGTSADIGRERARHDPLFDRGLDRELGAVRIEQPIDRGAEIRCFMRDPDGYLIEVGQLVGRPED